jgi:mannose-1-phosphate guanylyltransferase/mannose-6-phosphate isomerase
LDPALFARPIIVTNTQYRFLVAEQLAEIGAEADILLEPVRRDSGPAIAAGAAYAEKRTNNPIVVALAADHVISDPATFVKACGLAAAAAAADRIVTFGVHPTRPATEYGYIRPGASIGADIFAVDKFVEKPDEVTAERYLKEGYLWNSGNFMFRARLLLAEYEKFEAQSYAAVLDARERILRMRRRKVDRLRGHGADQNGGRDAGLLRLVRCWLLAGGLGTVRPRQA